MAPKKAAGTTKKAGAASTHGSYKDMIKVAIVQLKDRMGSSRPAIKKYIQANNNLSGTTDEALSRHVNSAIASGVKSGDFVQPKGPSGTVKLAKKTAEAPKTSAPAKAKATTKKPAAKKASTKAAPKKVATTKKATAPKTKANVAKPRKTPTKKATTTAPAVVTKKPVVIGKTKSGRVTKSSAPTASAKKAAPKKAAPKKTATPKAKA